MASPIIQPPAPSSRHRMTAAAPSQRSLELCRAAARGLCCRFLSIGGLSSRFRSIRGLCRRSGSCSNACAGGLRHLVQARCRRQAAGRGLWPGRSHQHLCDRCRRLDHHAADRQRCRRAAARPRASPPKYPPNCATAISAIPRSRWRSIPTGRSSFSARSQAPGQYPYVPNMSVESAVAIAGGFSPRAKRDTVTLTHTDAPVRRAWWCRSAPRSAPAIPCWSANAGSEKSRLRGNAYCHIQLWPQSPFQPASRPLAELQIEPVLVTRITRCRRDCGTPGRSRRRDGR